MAADLKEGAWGLVVAASFIAVLLFWSLSPVETLASGDEARFRKTERGMFALKS